MIKKTVELPQEVLELFISILDQYKDFVGETPLRNGFLIKKSPNKATITIDKGSNIYTAKMVYSHNKWEVVGTPSIWDNIKDITMI